MIEDAIPQVTVVIPTYNRRELLRQAILSLSHQSYPKDKYEVVVVDNSSVDGTEESIRELKESASFRISYYRKENKGPAPARNVGIRNAKGSIIAFTDSDCTAHPDWIRNGVRCFTDNDIGFVSGQILPKPDQKISFFVLHSEVTKEHPVYPTMNIFYRRDVLIELGGFDETFATESERPEGGEDVDLAWRVKRGGWRNVFAKDVIIYHEQHNMKLSDVVFKNCWRWRKLPLIAKKVPELRENLFFYYVFMDRDRPFIYLSIIGIVLASVFNKFGFVMFVIPYIYVQCRKVIYDYTDFGHIAKGVIKVCVLSVRDIIGAFISIYGSVRYRSILL